MVRVPKRASKRQSTKQRAKVTKKVREHHRKQRRDAKKNPQWKSKKKADPGIPNSFPFKEQLLDEIQMRRDREQQRKLDERERKIAERKAKKGLVGEGDDEDEDEDESDDADEDEEDDVELETAARPVTAAVYTGSLEDLLTDKEVSDVIICLDARDPSAWRLPQLESAAKGKGKAVHIALTRSDLVPFESLASHLHALSAQAKTAKAYPVSVHSSESLQPLVKAVQSNKKLAGVAVLGLEHSGRSTLATFLLNALEGGKVFDTAHLLPIRASPASKDTAEDDDDDEEEEPSDEDEMDTDEEIDETSSSADTRNFARRTSSALRALLRNKGQVQRAKDVLPLLWALLPLVSQTEDLMLLYNVPAFGSYRPAAVPAELVEADDEVALAQHRARELRKKTIKDTEEFLIGLARVQGRAKKHGIPDIYAAARIVLRDWCSGSLGYYTMAQGWTSIPKSQREKILAGYDESIEKFTPTRKEWKKTFVEVQKARRDLHPSPAIGELRLKSAGVEAVATGGDAGASVVGYEFHSPRAPSPDVDDEDEDEEEGEDDDEDEEMDPADAFAAQGYSFDADQDDDEDLDSDALVPEDEDEDEDEEDEE